jgi:hypothetical protein
MDSVVYRITVYYARDRIRANFLTGSRGEIDPATDPQFVKPMERTGIEPATSWLQIKT